MLVPKKLIPKSFINWKSQSTLKSHYSTKRVYHLKTQASKKYAPDGTGKHKAQLNSLCDQKDCETKNCKTPCDEIKGAEVTGNYTHASKIKGQPQVKVKKISNTDFDGKQKDQYFAKLPRKINIPKSELDNMTENDIILDKKATKIINADPNILKEVS